MKAVLHVTGLEDMGAAVEVTAQGRAKNDARWRPLQAWKFKVPDHVARRWMIGQKLKIEVKPA